MENPEEFALHISEYDKNNVEKVRDLSSIREDFKRSYLIVDDGYDYESLTPPEDLPTVFHGTSAWFKDDIEKRGLENNLETIASVEEIFKVDRNLHTSFKNILKHEKTMGRMRPEENTLRQRVYCTYNHENSSRYTRGSEIISDYLEHIKARSGWVFDQPFDTNLINSLGEIDSREKKILMSCLKPEPLIVHIKGTKKEFDSEATLEYGGNDIDLTFLTDSGGRKKLFSEIDWARKKYLQHSLGDLVKPEEASRLWHLIQPAAEHTNPQEFELLPVKDLVQIYLRSSFKELLFHKIDHGSITKLETT